MTVLLTVTGRLHRDRDHRVRGAKSAAASQADYDPLLPTRVSVRLAD